MSADNISTCPQCKEETLRQYWDIGTNKDGIFIAEYTCKCNECGFIHNFFVESDALEIYNDYKDNLRGAL